MDFNTSKDSYRDTVEDVLSFAGQGLDFYTRAKADAFARILRRDGMTAPRVLDIGCGHGFIHPLLAQQGCEVVGVEMAAEVLPLAQAANPGVEYHAYDGQLLPFADESFDVALTICVMHHVPPPQWLAFLAQARRVLRPGGRVVIFEHNPWNPMTRYVVSRNDIDADAVLLSHRKLKSMLRASGFRSVASGFILFTPFAQSLARRAETYLEWLPLGAQYYATGMV